MNKTVTFPRWPTWNYHFPELDVDQITAVNYWPNKKDAEQQTYPLEKIRLAIGHNGVSGIVFKEIHTLPETAERPDAVSIEYEAAPPPG
jgi:hypothetical protein